MKNILSLKKGTPILGKEIKDWINYNTNKEKELSQATKNDNKIDTKIVL